jgi:hypothetical protein
MYLASMTKSEFVSFLKSTISEAINEERSFLKSLKIGKDEEYSTITNVTEKFKVTKATVHNWAKRKLIKKYKINGRTLYKIAEIELAFA